jgi:hypothetical protein
MDNAVPSPGLHKICKLWHSYVILMPTSVLTQVLLLSTLFQDHKSLFERQHASFHVGMFGKQQSHLTYLYSQQYPGLLKENEWRTDFNFKNMYLQNENLTQPAFVFSLYVLHLFTIMLHINLHHFNLHSSFLINALWLVAFYHAKSLFLMGVPIFFYLHPSDLYPLVQKQN